MHHRRRRKPPVQIVKNYRFFTNTRDEVLISAKDIQDAKTQFQERFGYWPTKGINYVGHPNGPTAEASTPEDDGGPYPGIGSAV